jgi:RimJ/RimL family protein N-acetyltransferase
MRPIDGSDLDALFEQMRDPESVRMAASTAENPDGRTAFDVHMAKIRTLPEATTRAITVDGRRVGIAGFVVDGDTEVTYWIDRSFWGHGIAGRALALLLESFRVRPLFARAASHNVRSLKVLQRAGFAIIATAISFANARNKEIEETILRLDEPAKSAPPMRRARTGGLTDLGMSGCSCRRERSAKSAGSARLILESSEDARAVHNGYVRASIKDRCHTK